MNGITKISDVKSLLGRAVGDLRSAIPEIRALAASEDWKEREVAATLLVEAGKKKPDEVVAEMFTWADDPDPNVRRCASEGLRGVTRKEPDIVFPVLAKLKADSDLYVKKSVANVLRNAGNYHADKVFDLCRKWATNANANTSWIIKDGLRKLKIKYPNEVEAILASLK